MRAFETMNLWYRVFTLKRGMVGINITSHAVFTYLNAAQNEEPALVLRLGELGCERPAAVPVVVSLGWAVHPAHKVARWQNLIPSFLSLRRGGGRGGAIQGKDGIRFCSAA